MYVMQYIQRDAERSLYVLVTQAQVVLQCSSSALVVTHKPNRIPHEMVCLDVTVDGRGFSACKRISGAKSSNTIRTSVVMRACRFKRGGEEKKRRPRGREGGFSPEEGILLVQRNQCSYPHTGSHLQRVQQMHLLVSRHVQ